MLWKRIRELGMDGLRDRIDRSLENAAYLEQRLKELGVPAWRNPNAIPSYFRRSGPASLRSGNSPRPDRFNTCSCFPT